ncbi:hypothetical protein VFPPC_18246 [Pochonia chlamydosporia 170]|uniref:Uncharacterized protein n=1 Tax=Pochonia chlamydosporia 170 TaxID=1380566 RepID=A0A219AQH5_METCM|nr:hypothetical protein VFPPC_18246 [Pochonia chlamydosporia 170]OWT43033.1 hypothetical protein VFPPC_18246 [Pochonia chlamydosporia 170]
MGLLLEWETIKRHLYLVGDISSLSTQGVIEAIQRPPAQLPPSFHEPGRCIMCTQYYITKIYQCGDRYTEDVNFERCGNPSKPNHELKRQSLGTKSEESKCGRYGCRKP